MLDQQQYETLLNILQGNSELTNAILTVASDNQLEHFIIDITNSINDENPEAFVETVLQYDGEVAKRLIDLVASNDQLKDSIINEIDDQDFQKLVGTVLQNNGEVDKRAIDLAASDDQLKNAICDIDGKNPEKAGEKIMGVITRAIDDIESSRKFSTSLGKDTNQNKKAPVQSSNGGKPSTFLGKLNEYKGKLLLVYY